MEDVTQEMGLWHFNISSFALHFLLFLWAWCSCCHHQGLAKCYILKSYFPWVAASTTAKSGRSRTCKLLSPTFLTLTEKYQRAFACMWETNVCCHPLGSWYLETLPQGRFHASFEFPSWEESFKTAVCSAYQKNLCWFALKPLAKFCMGTVQWLSFFHFLPSINALLALSHNNWILLTSYDPFLLFCGTSIHH